MSGLFAKLMGVRAINVAKRAARPISTRPGVLSAGRARMLNVSPYSLERAGRGRVGFFHAISVVFFGRLSLSTALNFVV